MKTTEFVKALQEKLEGNGIKLTANDTRKVIDTVTATIVDGLVEGKEVPVPGLGKFTKVFKEAYEGRNPSNGETLQVAAKHSPKFKFSSTVKDAVK